MTTNAPQSDSRSNPSPLKFVPKSGQRLAPSSTDAEVALLGSILIAPAMLPACALIVTHEDFYLSKHGTIWRAMNDMRLRGEPIDMLTVSDTLQREGLLTSAGGAAYIVGLANGVPTHVNAPFYAELIARAARRRDLLKVADTMRELAYDESTDLNVVLDSVQMQLADVSAQARRGGVVGLSELVEIAIRQVERRMEGEMPLTLTTGMIDLDHKLDGGWWRGKVHYVMARTHNGKSLVAKNAALSAAKAGVPTMIISTEIPRDDLMQELIAIEAGLPSYLVKTGQLSGAQFGALLEAATRVNRMPLVIVSSRTLSAAELQTLVEENVRTHDVQLVVVDYLQNMYAPPDKFKSKVDQIDYFSRSIVTITQRFNVAMVVTAQVNRQVEYRTDKRPTAADGDGSSKIEKDPDVLIGLYIPSRYDKTAPSGAMEILVLKNRLTQRYGTVNVVIDSNSERIRNGVRSSAERTHRRDLE